MSTKPDNLPNFRCSTAQLKPKPKQRKPKLPEGFIWVKDAGHIPDSQRVVRLLVDRLPDGTAVWSMDTLSDMGSVRQRDKTSPEAFRCVMELPASAMRVEYEDRFKAVAVANSYSRPAVMILDMERNGVCVLTICSSDFGTAYDIVADEFVKLYNDLDRKGLL